jgi:Periplasmic copper-binding protein (NosD)
MSLRRALAGMTLTVGMVAALTPGAASAAGGTTRMVDDDGHAASGNCASSAVASSSIQDAIDAAHHGDTVLVCPGTYTEQLTIATDDLTVKSTRKWAAVIKAPPILPEEYLVGIGDADRITFEGFKVVAPTSGDCTDVVAAILVIGTKDTFVRGNQVRAAGSDTLGSCGFEIGVALGADFVTPVSLGVTPSNAPRIVTHAAVIFNSIQDFKAAGIVASGLGTDANINRNSIRYYHLHHTSDDQCLNTVTNVTPAGTDVRQQLKKILKALPEQGTGIAQDIPFACYAVGILTGMDAHAVVKDNRVHSGVDALPELEPLSPSLTTPVLLAGIVDLYDEGTKTSRIADNLVYRTIVGVGVVIAQNTEVLDNRLTSNVIGVYVDSSHAALVRGNRAKGNLVGIGLIDGFHYFDSNANRFLDNDARGNFEVSCVDVTLDATSPFAGDRGTDNRWRNNTAEVGSSDPDGICGAVPPVVCSTSSSTSRVGAALRRMEARHTISC